MSEGYPAPRLCYANGVEQCHLEGGLSEFVDLFVRVEI